MIYILDTDTLIYLIRGLKAGRRSPGRHERALNLLARCRQAQREGHRVGISAITISELEYGARKSGRYEEEIGAVWKILTPFEAFDYDAVNCPGHYGHIRHELGKAGQTIGAMDLLIAAQALGREATLVTNNLEHFQSVPGLKVTTWD
jgi:tRNA(fMet)-specific endonuclease VapC